MSAASREIGQLGESRAQQYLIKNGYEIADVNFHSRYGEIDIIAVKNNIIAFVEVKTRAKNSVVKPAEAVNRSKIQKIIKTAQVYIMNKNIDLQPRFDICEVTFDDSDFTFKVSNYVKNAFSQEGDYAIF